jgi:hypothetical protein
VTIHADMFDKRYPSPLVWLGAWTNPTGMDLHGFHVWDRRGNWHGVYQTQSRAKAEAKHLN